MLATHHLDMFEILVATQLRVEHQFLHQPCIVAVDIHGHICHSTSDGLSRDLCLPWQVKHETSQGEGSFWYEHTFVQF